MSKQPNEDETAKMDWRNVRQVLQKPQTRGEQTSPQEKNLRDYFGDESFRELRELAEPVRAQATREQLGNVVLLPGIMGSHLSVVERGGDEDHVWVSLWRLVKGDMTRLKLSPDGKTNHNGEEVVANSLIGWYYARALETLQAEPFPYDWRVSVCDTADKLAVFVREKLGDGTFDASRPVHFVAHSMGGLVVRNFIRQHNDLWNEIKGRLVMLGTPNAGSFAAIQTLMGKNSLIKNLAAVLPFQSKADWYQIVNSFPGLYQLCPAKTDKPNIYDKLFWEEKFPHVLFDPYLESIPKFHQDLLDAGAMTIDKERMSYIAGVGYDTPTALKSLDSGDFDFDFTSDGDGTVSHLLGLLEGITTYYVKEAHGDLPNNKDVLRAVKEILQDGATTVLKTEKPLVTRSRAIMSSSSIEHDLEKIGTVIRQIQENKNPEQQNVFNAEKKILRALLGGDLDREDEPVSYLADETAEGEMKRLDVDLIHGYVETVNAPAVVVGQYKGLPPNGAIGAIDRVLDYWITYAHRNEMIGTDLGQLFVVPQNGKRLNKSVETVIIAGMGEFNQFSRDDLRYLIMNATLAVLTLGYNRFATVLVGTGSNNLSIERAVRSILSGVSDALDRQPYKGKKPFTLILVESRESRRASINEALEKIEITPPDKDKKPSDKNLKKQPIKGLEVEVKRIKSHLKPPKAKERPAFAPSKDEKEVARITVERKPGLFCLSALTSNAAIPMREIPVQDFIVDSLIGKLRLARDFKKQQKYGRLLHAMLIPEDFQSFLDTNRSLVLILNRAAAAIPWEMMGYGGKRGTTNFGSDLNVTRQFSSLSARVPSVAPPRNKVFKALIIADPAKDKSLRLYGARREGEELREYFTSLREELKGSIDFQFEARIGYEQCDIVEILSLIFDEEFDLVHFAGHGVFAEVESADGSTRNKNVSGWVFGRDKTSGELEILSAKEIFRLRRVPRLVFSNACFSSQIGSHSGGAVFTTDDNRESAGLAEAFFMRGIENYIGAGWQVNDNYAVEFAKTFYSQTLVSRKSLGDALGEARKIISSDVTETTLIDSTWGAYQHYGDSNETLVEKNETKDGK
jgi:pimeloyl-ACP methyl ester carboxylesterase